MSRPAASNVERPSFVARLWLEEGPRRTLSWRGKVKHVQGDRQAYFDSFEELGSFLQEVSGVAAPGSVALTATHIEGARE
jgi:hypothetical protein